MSIKALITTSHFVKYRMYIVLVLIAIYGQASKISKLGPSIIITYVSIWIE